MVTKLVALLAVLGLLVAINIAYLMLGWGLHPQSWSWVIGLGFVGQVVVRWLAERVLKEVSR